MSDMASHITTIEAEDLLWKRNRIHIDVHRFHIVHLTI